MFNFFKSSNELLNRRDKKRVVEAIQDVERRTSGEVRVYIEGVCPFDQPMQRAVEIFAHLGMDKTTLRNGVLLYIATESRVFAIYGDEGIYTKAGQEYWNEKAGQLKHFFQGEKYRDGIIHCVKNIGDGLASFFPPTGQRKNELPDDIVFGKF